MTQPQPRTDRHASDSVQLKVWVPEHLRARFFEACGTAGLVPAVVVRAMLADFSRVVGRSVSSDETAGEEVCRG